MIKKSKSKSKIKEWYHTDFPSKSNTTVKAIFSHFFSLTVKRFCKVQRCLLVIEYHYYYYYFDSGCIAQANLELIILYPQPPEFGFCHHSLSSDRILESNIVLIFLKDLIKFFLTHNLLIISYFMHLLCLL